MIRIVFIIFISIIVTSCTDYNDRSKYDIYFNKTNIGITEQKIFEKNILLNGNNTLLTISKYYFKTNEMNRGDPYWCYIRTNFIFAISPEYVFHIYENSIEITNIDSDDSDEILFHTRDGGSHADLHYLYLYIPKNNKVYCLGVDLYPDGFYKKETNITIIKSNEQLYKNNRYQLYLYHRLNEYDFNKR